MEGKEREDGRRVMNGFVWHGDGDGGRRWSWNSFVRDFSGGWILVRHKKFHRCDRGYFSKEKKKKKKATLLGNVMCRI